MYVCIIPVSRLLSRCKFTTCAGAQPSGRSAQHKANYRLPEAMSVHPTTGERGPLPQCTFHPDTKAGDVVIFSGMGSVS